MEEKRIGDIVQQAKGKHGKAAINREAERVTKGHCSKI